MRAFRNTFIGPVLVQNVGADSGPFVLEDNVFVNDQPTGVACERCDATDRVELAGNLVLPSDTTAIGLDGRLVGEHAAQCGRVGHLRTCEPAP